MPSSITERKKRRNPRYYSHAKAYILKVENDEATVKDIGITGCCIAYKKQVDIKLHEPYIIRVVPEQHPLDYFDLLAESRWCRSRGEFCEIGFSIISSPFMFSQYKTKCRRVRP